MFRGLKSIARNRVLLVLLLLSGALLLIAAVVTVVNATHFTEPVILHASRAAGIDRIGTVTDYLGMFALGFIVWCGSVLAAGETFDAEKKRQYTYLLIGFAFFAALLTLVIVSYVAGLN